MSSEPEFRDPNAVRMPDGTLEWPKTGPSGRNRELLILMLYSSMSLEYLLDGRIRGQVNSKSLYVELERMRRLMAEYTDLYSDA